MGYSAANQGPHVPLVETFPGGAEGTTDILADPGVLASANAGALFEQDGVAPHVNQDGTVTVAGPLSQRTLTGLGHLARNQWPDYPGDTIVHRDLPRTGY